MTTQLNDDVAEAIEIMDTAENVPQGKEALENEIRSGIKKVDSGLTYTTEVMNDFLVPMWDTETGDMSVTRRDLIPLQVRKRREDGSRRFTFRQSEAPERRVGTLLCMLHKDHPDRAQFDQWNAPLCRKSNLVSAFDFRQHTQKRHQREWALMSEHKQGIQSKQLSEERKEDREFQREQAQLTRQLLESVIGNNRPENIKKDR